MKLGLIFLILFVCITTHAQKRYSLTELQKKSLTGERVDTDPLNYPFGLQFYDSLLIVRNYDADAFFDLIDLRNGKIINRFIKKGRGPGEMVYPISFQIIPEKNQFMTYDVNLRRVNFYDWQKILNKEADYYSSSFRIDSAYAKYAIQCADDSYICPLVGDPVGYKYCKLNAKKQFDGYKTLLPDLGKKFPTTVSMNIFGYWYGVNLDRTKVVLAYDKWDRLDVLTNLPALDEQTIFGPRERTPEFIVTGQNITMKGDHAMYAYCSPCVGKNSFLVLYSGVNLYPKNSIKQNPRIYHKVLHFDFDGNLIEYFEINPGIQFMAVDWDKHIIYGANNELEPVLYEYKF